MLPVSGQVQINAVKKGGGANATALLFWAQHERIFDLDLGVLAQT